MIANPIAIRTSGQKYFPNPGTSMFTSRIEPIAIKTPPQAPDDTKMLN